MAGGTGFHRVIQAKRALVAMSKNKNNSNSFLISENQNPETQRPFECIADPGHSTCPLTTPTRL
jgi:hypothetical protein